MSKRAEFTTTPDASKLPNDASSTAARKERKSLEARIKSAEEELRRLQELKRKADRAQREQNEREIRELIRGEGLDGFAAQAWRAAAGEIRTALQRAGSVP